MGPRSVMTGRSEDSSSESTGLGFTPAFQTSRPVSNSSPSLVLMRPSSAELRKVSSLTSMPRSRSWFSTYARWSSVSSGNTKGAASMSTKRMSDACRSG